MTLFGFFADLFDGLDGPSKSQLFYQDRTVVVCTICLLKIFDIRYLEEICISSEIRFGRSRCRGERLEHINYINDETLINIFIFLFKYKQAYNILVNILMESCFSLMILEIHRKHCEQNVSFEVIACI